jgi:uncharacterized Tic20 family protein
MIQPPPQPPPGYASVEDRTYALVAHFGGAVGTVISGGVLGVLGPLVALLARGDRSPVVREHARNALNFFIPVAAAAAALFTLGACLGAEPLAGPGRALGALLWLPQAAVWGIGCALGVVGGLKAREGAVYRYPLALPLIK